MERLRIDEDPTRSTTRYFEKPPSHVPMPTDGHDYVWALGCMWATKDQVASWALQGQLMDGEAAVRNKTARKNTNPE